MKIIDGRKLSAEILVEVKGGVASLNFQPVFCDILVGDDAASVQYVQMKAKTAESVGMKFHKANFPVSMNTDELVKEIKVLNRIPDMCGIIVQLPLPEHIDKQAVLDAIDVSPLAAPIGLPHRRNDAHGFLARRFAAHQHNVA